MAAKTNLPDIYLRAAKKVFRGNICCCPAISNSEARTLFRDLFYPEGFREDEISGAWWGYCDDQRLYSSSVFHPAWANFVNSLTLKERRDARTFALLWMVLESGGGL